MKNHTLMIHCMRCDHTKHKDEFSIYYSAKKVSKRWCNLCQKNILPTTEFNEDVAQNKKQYSARTQTFLKFNESPYAKQKRENKKRFEEIEDAKFIEQWEL